LPSPPPDLQAGVEIQHTYYGSTYYAQDLQTEVEIKVIALDASGSASLGSFTLSGIAPNRVGMPQVAPPP